MIEYEFQHAGETLLVRCDCDGHVIRLHVRDNVYELSRLEPGLYETRHDGRRILIAAARGEGRYFLDVDGYQLEVLDAADRDFGAAADVHLGQKDKIFAPMPGKVVKLLVELGQMVEAKQPVAIIEAMKMENKVLAVAAGKVKSINFAPGQQVNTEAPIIELELPEPAAGAE